ncbi:MAG: hypothetical protein WCS18_05175 [Sphaerochaetaceae bacterium]
MKLHSKKTTVSILFIYAVLVGTLCSCGDDASDRKEEAEYNTNRVSVYLEQVFYLDSVGTVTELTYEAMKRSFIRRNISKKDMMDMIDYAKDHYSRKGTACLTMKTNGDLSPDVEEKMELIFSTACSSYGYKLQDIAFFEEYVKTRRKSARIKSDRADSAATAYKALAALMIGKMTADLKSMAGDNGGN